MFECISINVFMLRCISISIFASLDTFLLVFPAFIIFLLRLVHFIIFKRRHGILSIFTVSPEITITTSSSSPSHKIIIHMYILGLIGNSVTCDEVWLGSGDPAGPAQCIRGTVCILSVTHGWPSDVQRERYIYILSAEEKFLSTQCHPHLVLWRTGSHCIIIIFTISNFISLLLITLWKSTLILF